MVLLVSLLSGAHECATRLAAKLPEVGVEWASGVREARERARKAPGEAVIFLVDSSTIDMTSRSLDVLVEESGGLVVPVNLVLSDLGRLEREARASLRRAELQKQSSFEVARKQLFSEVKEQLTEVLLRLQFALRSPSIAAMEPSVQAALQAAERIRERLDAARKPV
jgi:hypothetical protein